MAVYFLVHGEWAVWEPVSECKHSCGDAGHRIQKRYCANPAPLYGGDDCVGNNERNFTCPGTSACIRTLK